MLHFQIIFILQCQYIHFKFYLTFFRATKCYTHHSIATAALKPDTELLCVMFENKANSLGR